MCLSTHTLFTPSTLVAPSTAGWEQLCRRTPKVLRNPLASAPRKLACLALHMFVCCCSVTVRCHAGMVVLLLLIEVCLEAASAPARHITADFCVDCSIPFPWVVQLRHAWACTPCKPSSSPALWRCSAQHFSLPLLKVCCASGMQGMDALADVAADKKDWCGAGQCVDAGQAIIAESSPCKPFVDAAGQDAASINATPDTQLAQDVASRPQPSPACAP